MELGFLVGEGVLCLRGWEMIGRRRESGKFGSRSVNGVGFYKGMGVMGWK